MANRKKTLKAPPAATALAPSAAAEASFLPLPHEPPADCAHCPRLAAFRADNRKAFPDFFNAPVPGFGAPGGRLLIVGLAPGLKGANCTGRPFTGDFAGDLLYDTLLDFGFAKGRYEGRPDDGLQLLDCRIVNAVRCVPPQNKPTGAEARNCRPYLAAELTLKPGPSLVLALGAIAHTSVLAALGVRRAAHPFGHGSSHRLAEGLQLIDSYHCSRYNTNTGRLTVAMFRDIFLKIRASLAA
jgi:uracil-DNA glycosylase family 4